ncbi:hypothetical protein DFP72DRAFT_1095284 [Ephemerocybe angulata]|uniref:Uncharacterized protein n=1 Tax=Ephemerocybe angulata TaxID=980116 RepID=A0A8H6HDN2_9AGAR|nr:hypothetical protein DFP72DRAFT_1095284 [Tulosesus angulatus]
MSSPPPTKKHKASDLSGLELESSIAHLRNYRSSLIAEDVPESESDSMAAVNELDGIIGTLESRLNEPSSYNIEQKGMLKLKPWDELREAIATSRDIGSGELWSNDMMYKHLLFLFGSFKDKNETPSRTLIDTFFFRAGAMIPPPHKLVMMLENTVPASVPRESNMDTIYYTAIVAEKQLAKYYIQFPPLLNEASGGQMVAFFTVEAKSASAGSLLDHIPQAVVELIACAKRLGKSHIRGALTTGIKWHFVAVDLNADKDGAKYWASEVIQFIPPPANGSLPETDTSLIAAVLSEWIQHSFEEFKEDQWFIPIFL